MHEDVKVVQAFLAEARHNRRRQALNLDYGLIRDRCNQALEYIISCGFKPGDEYKLYTKTSSMLAFWMFTRFSYAGMHLEGDILLHSGGMISAGAYIKGNWMKEWVMRVKVYKDLQVENNLHQLLGGGHE